MSFGYQVLGFGSGGASEITSDYVIGTGPDGATGTADGDYKYHKFIATKTGAAGFSVKSTGGSGSSTVEYLLVAGGGNAGGDIGAGAGGGGYRTFTGGDAFSVEFTNYDVTIGGSASTSTVFGNSSTYGGGGANECGSGGRGGSAGGNSNCSKSEPLGNLGGYSPS